MMAYLRFRLPEEQEEYEDAVKGQKWRAVVEEFDEELRRVLKHGDDRLTEQEIATYERLRTRLWDLRTERGLTE